MVQTRSASGVDVPPPPATPAGPVAGSVRSTRTRKITPPSSSSITVSTTAPVAAPAKTPAKALAKAASAKTPAKTKTKTKAKTTATTTTPWVYVPDTLTLVWLAVSLPLVAWDTGYVLLRPRTMPGGSLHWPLWAPYALYGEVDHVYGFKQWHAHSGFTGAQAALNLAESVLYGGFLYLWLAHGRAPPKPMLAARKALTGRPAAWAVLLAFSAAVMTLSKTVLYWLNEYFSGFDNIGHNDLYSLVVLWIIPNGMWLVLPTYMIYVLGGEMLNVLAGASEGGAATKE